MDLSISKVKDFQFSWASGGPHFDGKMRDFLRAAHTRNPGLQVLDKILKNGVYAPRLKKVLYRGAEQPGPWSDDPMLNTPATTHSAETHAKGVEADHAKAKANNLHGFVAVALVFGLVGLSVDNIPLLQSNDLVGKDASLANSFCSSCKVKVDIHAFVGPLNVVRCHACKLSGDVQYLVTSAQETQSVFKFVHKHLPKSMAPSLADHRLLLNIFLNCAAQILPTATPCTSNLPLVHAMRSLESCVGFVLDYYKVQNMEVTYTKVSEYLDVLKPNYKGQKYPKLNNYALIENQDNVLYNFMKEQRRNEECLGASRGMRDLSSTCLLMFSSRNAVTPFHHDWTEAKNVALGIEGVTDGNVVVATWYFLNPLFVSTILPILRSLQNAFGGKGKLREEDCEYLVKMHPNAFIRLDQRVGYLVYVPPGWMHTVFTKAPCLKMAWDFVLPQHLPLYMASWLGIATKVPNTSDDYMATMPLLVKHALSAE